MVLIVLYLNILFLFNNDVMNKNIILLLDSVLNILLSIIFMDVAFMNLFKSLILKKFKAF